MYRNLIRLALTACTAGVAILTSGAPALAAAPPPLAVADLPTVIGNMTAWITGILAAVATLFLTIGGTRLLMAGDPTEAEQAKVQLRRAGIGYCLALLAPIILSILQQILGA